VKMHTLVIALVFIPVLLVMAGCGDPAKVSAEEFGDAWPLTVDRATLHCSGGSAVWMSAGGRNYALNGTAMTYLTMRAPNLILSDLEMIWRVDPKYNIQGAQGTVRVSISPLIERGLTLCG